MLGERLKILREEKNLSQKELASIMSMSTSAIAMHEKNLREPDDDTKIKYAKFFNCTIDYLLGLSNDKKSKLSYIDIQNLTPNDISEVKVFIDFIKYKKRNIGKSEAI